jgi:hypothetical protein
MRYETAIEMSVAIDRTFSGKVKKYRASRLVVGSFNIVTLLIGPVVVRRVDRAVREMVNLGPSVVQTANFTKNDIVQFDQNSTLYG